MSPRPAAKTRRFPHRSPSSFGPQAAWIGLAASLVIAGASGAEAAVRPLSRDPACAASAGSCAKAPAIRRTPAAPAADAALGSAARLILTADRSVPRVLEGAAPGVRHGNPFTLVGNRTGLESAAHVEVRGGETWLVPAPVRATGLATFQDGASSVASR